jgi:hypothetical protein
MSSYYVASSICRALLEELVAEGGLDVTDPNGTVGRCRLTPDWDPA